MTPTDPGEVHGILALYRGEGCDDLPARTTSFGPGYITTAWELTDAERAAIAEGARVMLVLVGAAVPVQMQVEGVIPVYA